MRQHTASWVAVGGRLFTVLASMGISCPVRLVERPLSVFDLPTGTYPKWRIARLPLLAMAWRDIR
jgi:hypothetical protein